MKTLTEFERYAILSLCKQCLYSITYWWAKRNTNTAEHLFWSQEAYVDGSSLMTKESCSSKDFWLWGKKQNKNIYLYIVKVIFVLLVVITETLIFGNLFILVRVVVDPKPRLEHDKNTTKEVGLSHAHKLIHTVERFRAGSPPTGMFLGSGRKLENLGENCWTAHGELSIQAGAVRRQR